MMESQEQSVQWLRQIAGTLVNDTLEENRRFGSDDLSARDLAIVCLANGLLLYRRAPDIGDKLLTAFGDDLAEMEQVMEDVVDSARKTMGLR